MQTSLGNMERLKQLTEGLRIPQVVRSAQGVAVSGEEALLLTLRRLSYPNQWYDIEPLIGRASSTMSTIISQVMAHIDRAFGHLLDDLKTHTWLTLDDLNVFSLVSAKNFDSHYLIKVRQKGVG
ncbi:hypothetical protein MTO96_043465 [Rhipicephalus appendiculatus]